ncbi:phosphoribosylaminoimidazolesuccinocarboxamide synthase [Bifidobacterium sp. ESL0745]|uniref:phosphoribosylaminoimidazolesuccinocarboxamide synthase n=1 Tax=Bifidobacterium sp. ESL0745 TaxID=2983226 RepID=UPI0023F6E299|nr:phosphoribosylaminoimidazolesuccinocarboxamide synthase [Bifidobacterium sp. ESL0745]MDF7664856.1 phosphoribosylaminoimidazolesuccinocarboxamide synthase [Bifidobacterium sp. ESL0745]
MEKLDMLYKGKAKKLYSTDDPNVLWVEYMNQATAGDGAKKAQIQGKGSLNNRITTVLFRLLEAEGVETDFIRRVSDTEQLNEKITMFPLEIIMRNTAAGSFAKRYGIEEGTELKRPILEFCFKSDELHDPFINVDGIVALGLATDEDMAEVSRQTRDINEKLTKIFRDIDVKLVDFKIEEGKNKDGEIVLADEITPDTCRLWDMKDGSGKVEHLDKDLFRRNLGDIIPAYEEIYKRLLDLANRRGVKIE